MANHGTKPPQAFGNQPKSTGLPQGQVQNWEDLSHILPEGGPEAGFQLRHETGPEEGSGSVHLHGPGGKWLARVAYTGKDTDNPQWVFHTGDQVERQPRVHTPVVNHLARALGHVFQPRPQFQNLLDEAHESEDWNRDLDGAESMLKAEGKKKGGTWAGRSILDGEDAKGLETEAALREFRDRRPRAEAEEDAHRQYRQGHHQKAAAHHLRGMKMAQASGQTEEAHKHSVMYALHLQKLGHDPYKEPPPEVRALLSKEPDQKQYRYKDHGGDGFILEKGEELSPGLVLKKAWPRDDQENNANAANQQVMEDAVLEQGGQKKDVSGQAQKQVMRRYQQTIPDQGDDGRDYGKLENFLDRETAVLDWNAAHSPPGEGPAPHDTVDQGPHPANLHQVERHKGLPAHDRAGELSFWGRINQAVRLKPSPVPDFKKVKKAWPKTDQENEANRAGFVRESPPTGDRLMEQGLGTKTEHDQGGTVPSLDPVEVQKRQSLTPAGIRGRNAGLSRAQFTSPGTEEARWANYRHNVDVDQDDDGDHPSRAAPHAQILDELTGSLPGHGASDSLWRVIGRRLGLRKQEDKTNPGVKPQGLVGNSSVPPPLPMGSGVTNTHISATAIKPKPLPAMTAPPSLKITPQKAGPGGLVPPPAPVGVPAPAVPHRLDLGPGMAGHPRQISAPAIKPVAPLGAWKSELPSLWQKLVKALPKTHAENQELAAHDQVLQDHLRETFPFETDTAPNHTVGIAQPPPPHWRKRAASKAAAVRGTDAAQDANNRQNWRTYDNAGGELGPEYRHWEQVDNAAEKAAGDQGSKPIFRPGDKVMRANPEAGENPWVGVVMPHTPSEYEDEEGNIFPQHPNGPSWRDYDIDGPGHYYNVRWTSDRGNRHDDWLHQQLLKPAGGWPDPIKKGWPKDEKENQANAQGFASPSAHLTPKSAAVAMDSLQQTFPADAQVEELDSEAVAPKVDHYLNTYERNSGAINEQDHRIYDAADANAMQDAARASEQLQTGEPWIGEPASPYVRGGVPFGGSSQSSLNQLEDDQRADKAFWHRIGRAVGLKKAWPQKIAPKDRGGTHPMRDPAAAATHAVLQDSIQERGDVREVKPKSMHQKVAQAFRDEGHEGAYDVGTMGGDLPLDRAPTRAQLEETGDWGDDFDGPPSDNIVDDRMEDYADNAPPDDAADLASRVGEPRLSQQDAATQTLTQHPRIVATGLEHYSLGAWDAVSEHRLWSSLRNELKKVKSRKITKAWPKTDQENQANKAGFPLGDKAITDPGEQAVAQDHLNATMGGNATQAPAGDLPGLAEKNREILGQWEEPADPEMGTCANCGLDHMDHMMNDRGSEICPPNLDGSDAGTEYRDNWAGSQGQMLSAATYDHTGYGNTVPPPHPGISQAVLTNEKGLGQNPREPTDASRWGWTEGRASLDLDQRFWSILGRAAGVNKGG